MVALHTTPRQTVEELTSLTKVVSEAHRRWPSSSVLILGDLNADCDYVPKNAWPSIPLRQESQYWWAIDDSVDTTVSTNTDCAYDRWEDFYVCVCIHV
jgi:hypothetical protein